jgi:hypothetical protein
MNSLPILDFSIFNTVNPMIFILCTLIIIFMIITTSEITMLVFMKIFMFCESAFNKLDLNKSLNMRFKKW